MTTFTPKDIPEGINVSKGHPFKDALKLLASIGGFIFIVYLSLGWIGQTLAEKISYETELKLADKYFNTSSLVDKEKASADAIKLQSLSDSLWQPFDDGRGIKLNTSVLGSKGQNAFMAPGGFLSVTQGLLNSAETENELSFVVCHEIGHFYHRHALKGLGRQFALLMLSSVLNIGGADLEMFKSGINLTELTYNREHETEADEFAIDCMNKKYNHVNGYDSFFKRIALFSKGDAKGQFFKYFSTHPLSEERIQYLKDFALKKGYSLKGDLSKGFY